MYKSTAHLFFASIAGIHLAALALPQTCQADENLLGYTKGSETLPIGSWEAYEILTSRTNKGHGRYQALDAKTEVEYGVTDRFSVAGSLSVLTIDTSDILIDAYLPEDKKFTARPSGAEAAFKYNFLSAAKDAFGFSNYLSFDRNWLDSHSGQKKDTYSMELLFLVQKYFLEGELIWVGNFGTESTYAKRAAIEDLPDDFEWPDEPEMEIELLVSTGLSYRFVPKWFIGAESKYETEFETEVGQERWSYFGGPSLHYGSQSWWATVTYFSQLRGGGQTFDEQDNMSLHLIEKTKQETRLKVGLNF